MQTSIFYQIHKKSKGNKRNILLIHLKKCDIICHKEGPITDGRIPYDLRVHQHTSYDNNKKK